MLPDEVACSTEAVSETGATIESGATVTDCSAGTLVGIPEEDSIEEVFVSISLVVETSAFSVAAGCTEGVGMGVGGILGVGEAIGVTVGVGVLSSNKVKEESASADIVGAGDTEVFGLSLTVPHAVKETLMINKSNGITFFIFCFSSFLKYDFAFIIS